MTKNNLVDAYDARAELMVQRMLENKMGADDANVDKRNKYALDFKFTTGQIKVVSEFDRFKTLKGVKPWTRYSYVVWCRQFLAFVKKPFEKVTGRDLEDYFLSLQGKSPVTQFRHRTYAKFFFTWFYETYLQQPLPDWVRKIPRNKPNTKRSPQELLTKEELEKLYAVARHPMHQTMIRLLAESGLRRKELISLRIGDVSFEGPLTTIWANGKTGEGAVFLYDATPYLMSWLRVHPARNDKEAPVFYVIDKVTKKPKPLGLTTPNRIIKVLAERAGIEDKRIYGHLFRFTAATNDAVSMTDAMMRLKYRWSSYSQMPAHYASLHNGALKEQVMRHHGILKPEEQKAKPIECPSCHFVNLPGERFCTNCYRGITLEAVQEVDDRRKALELIQVMAYKRKKSVSLDDVVDLIHEIETAKPPKK
ncbi:MAG: tyrosine-type recombinase/integrase [Candidatus Micrarchaeota archaeon]